MTKGYTEAEVLQKAAEASADMAVFYQRDFINYRGRSLDTGKLYTEIVARWCCEHLDRFSAIPQITREASYKTEGHDGITDHAQSNREEELIAMRIFLQRELPELGRVVDYQTPLKNKRSDIAGKIDLLAWDGSVLRILELKKPDSQETMLRCVLEGMTYLRTVDRKKLLRDFCLPEGAYVKACPLVFLHGAQWEELQEDRPNLKRLMRLFDCKAFFIREENGKYISEG